MSNYGGHRGGHHKFSGISVDGQSNSHFGDRIGTRDRINNFHYSSDPIVAEQQRRDIRDIRESVKRDNEIATRKLHQHDRQHDEHIRRAQAAQRQAQIARQRAVESERRQAQINAEQQRRLNFQRQQMQAQQRRIQHDEMMLRREQQMIANIGQRLQRDERQRRVFQ